MRADSRGLLPNQHKDELPEALQDIFAGAFECVARIDHQGCFLSVNESYAKVFGFAREEMLGMPWQDTIYPDDRALITEKFSDVKINGRAEAEIRGLRKNGSIFYKQLLMVKGLKSDTSSVHHYCFINDITEKVMDELTVLKSVKSGLESQEQNFYELTREIPAVVFQTSTHQHWSFEYLSPGIERILGIPAFDLLKNGISKYKSFIHADDLVRVERIVANAIARKSAYSVEYRVQKENGETRWLRERASCSDLRQRNGEWFVGIIQDISDEKEVETQLSIAQTLIDNASALVVWINEAGEIVYANNFACEKLGYSRKELLSLSAFDIDHNFTPENRRRYLKTLDNFSSKSIGFESSLRHKNGSELIVEVVSNIVDIDSNKYTCVFARDLHEDKVNQLGLQIHGSIFQQILSGSSRECLIKNMCLQIEEAIPGCDVHILVPKANGKSINYQASTPLDTELHDYIRKHFTFSSSNEFENARQEKMLPGIKELPVKRKSFNELSIWEFPLLLKDSQFPAILLVSTGSNLYPHDIKVLHNTCELLGQVLSSSIPGQSALGLDHLLGSVNDLVSFVDKDYRLRNVSERYAEFHGCEREELVGKTYADIVGEDFFIDTIQAHLDRGLAGEQLELRDWVNTRDGLQGFFNIKIRPVYENDQVAGVLVVMTDITQLFNTTEALRESRNQYNKVVDTSLDLLLITRFSDGKVFTANEVFADVTGYSISEIIGQKATKLYADPGDREKLVKALDSRGYCKDFKTAMKSRDGREIPVILSSNLIDYRGEKCILTITRDLSEYSEAQCALRDKEKTIELLKQLTIATNESSGLEKALQSALKIISEYCAWPIAHVWVFDDDSQDQPGTGIWNLNEENSEIYAGLSDYLEKEPIQLVPGLAGKILKNKTPIWIEDLSQQRHFPEFEAILKHGISSVFAFPVLVEEQVVAVLQFFSKSKQQKDGDLLADMVPVGIQVGRIIERTQAKLALKRSQVNFSKAITASPDGVIIIRIEDGKILDFNDAVLVGTGYSRSELLNATGMMFWVDQQACVEHAKTVKKLGQVANYSMLIRCKDGTTIPCLMSSSLIYVDGEKCIFSIVKNISDLALAHEKLIEIKERGKVVSGSTSISISYVDRQFRYIYVNDCFENEYGIKKEEIAGKTIQEVMGEDRFQQFQPYIQEALSGCDVKFDYSYRKENDSNDVIELTLYPDRKDDIINGIYIASINITEKRKTEHALLRKNRALKVLSDISRRLITDTNQESLLNAVCEVITEPGGYQLAWIGVCDKANPERVNTIAFAENFADASAVQIRSGNSRLIQTLSRRVIRDNRPAIAQYPSDNLTSFQYDAEALCKTITVLGIPLQSHDNNLGVLVIASLDTEAFDNEETGLLKACAENLAYGMTAFQETRLRLQAEKLLALENHAFQIITNGKDLHTMLNELVTAIEANLDGFDCSVLLTGKDNSFYDGASPNLDQQYIAKILSTSEGHLFTESLLGSEKVIVEDTFADSSMKKYCGFERRYNYRAFNVNPVRAPDERLLGTLSVYSKSEGKPQAHEQEILDRMTFIIGGAIDNFIAHNALKQSEERLALAIRGSQDGLWDINLETMEVYWSPSWKSMLGYEEHELTPSLETFQKLLHPDHKNIHEIVIENMEEKLQLEFKMKHKQGHYVDILSRATGFRKNSGGEIVRIVGTHVDLTERNQAASQIRESESKFRVLYDDSPSMFITLDEMATILSINKFGADHLGIPVDKLIGRSMLEIIHSEDAKVLREKLQACVKQANRVQRCELRTIHKYGDIIWIRATMRLTGLEENRHNILVTCEDISEARILSEQLEYQANHDALTGLINRVEFEKRLRRVLNSSESESDHALCYLDLDQFKIINDTCGHLAGDELLRRVGDVLNTVVRKRDTLARMGGDEFAVLLEHCPPAQAKRVANELLRSIESLRFTWEGKRFVLGVSIGLVPMRSGSGSLTDILSAADEACYAAKDSGRNRVHVYHSDDAELSRRRGEMEWVARINQALEEDLFCLHAQSIGKLQPGNTQTRGNHYEILLRMRGDDGELIYPGAFLSAAERYNMSEKIDQWVVEKTLQWLTTEKNELAALSVCSINLSGQSMSERQFLDFILQQFKKYPVPAQKICFEITETSAIDNLGAAIKFIHALKEIGCLFALDDFGTGVSSFNYLKNLPVDFLKIDGSFIKDIDKDPIDFAMVRSINEIGQVMGKETIAEFVETEEILEVILEIGINYAQGYTIGKSVPIEMLSA